MSTHRPALSSRDMWSVLVQHKRKVIIAFCTTFCLFLVAAVFWPETYISEAKLFVRVGRESVTLDPTATTGDTIHFQRSQESEINSLLDILSSRGVAERVVDVIGAERILGDGEMGSGNAPRSGVPGLRTVLHAASSAREGMKDLAGNAPELTAHEMATGQIEQMTEVSAPKHSTVISVRCKARCPKLAQEIAATMTEVFLEEHARLNRTRGSHEFFAQQESQVRLQLDTAAESLRDSKNKFGMLSIDGKRQLLEGQLSTIQLEKLVTERELVSSEGRIHDLEEKLTSIPEEIVTQVVMGHGNEAWDNMRQQLYELEIREQELLSKYSDEHPFVLAVRKQRAKVEGILEKQEDKRTETTRGLNPTLQTLQTELVAEHANRASLRSRRDLLVTQLQHVRRAMEEFNDQELEIAKLEQKSRLLQSTHQTHYEKLEQARIDEALQNKRITNVNMVQPASLISVPVSPKRRLILLGGLIVATCCAVNVAFLSEYVQRAMAVPKQYEVNQTLPAILKQHEEARMVLGRDE